MDFCALMKTSGCDFSRTLLSKGMKMHGPDMFVKFKYITSSVDEIN